MLVIPLTMAALLVRRLLMVEKAALPGVFTTMLPGSGREMETPADAVGLDAELSIAVAPDTGRCCSCTFAVPGVVAWRAARFDAR